MDCIIPPQSWLKEFNRKADAWLASRGERVGGFAETIKNHCKVNKVAAKAARKAKGAA